ncbi:MAG: ABC transporter permease [Lachnospiraceae bacterium]
MKQFFKDFKKYFGYATYAAGAELRAEVASSYLNWLWWVLEPFCFMVIYSFMFSIVFNSRMPFFNIYIFLGLTIWNFFKNNLTASVRMVKNNKQIIKKVYLPKIVLIMVRMMVNEFKMLVSFGIVCAMMIFYQTPLTWRCLWVIPILVLLNLVTFAAMTILLHFGVFIEDLSNIVRIGLKMVFYITGIFYSVEDKLPAPYGHYAMRLNPIALITDTFRKGLLYNQEPYTHALLLWAILSLVIAILGIKLIYKNENNYVKVV